MEAQKWVTPSAGCREEAEVREDDLGFSWGSLSSGCVRSARAGLPRVSCLTSNPPVSRACGRRPAPPPSSGEPQGAPPPSLVPAPPRSLHRARSFQHRGQRLGPRGRGACRAAAPPTPKARAWELRPLFTLRSRAGKDRKGGAVVVTFLSFGVLPPNHFWSAVPSPAHPSLVPCMSSWNLQSLGGRQSLPGHWFLLPISFRAQLLRAFCVLSPVLEARTIY